MKLKNDSVNIYGMHPCIRCIMGTIEDILDEHGSEFIVTSLNDGIHGPGSWHYVGAAIDIRGRHFDTHEYLDVAQDLKEALPGYEVHTYLNTSKHFHIEPSDALARKWGLLL